MDLANMDRLRQTNRHIAPSHRQKLTLMKHDDQCGDSCRQINTAKTAAQNPQGFHDIKHWETHHGQFPEPERACTRQQHHHRSPFLREGSRPHPRLRPPRTDLEAPTHRRNSRGHWPDPQEADPLVALVQDTSCRLLLVSPNRDGSSNTDNDILTDTTLCTCPKPTKEEALSATNPASSGLMFVAHHGCSIASKMYWRHRHWCGVKLLHDTNGTYHAAWVGPFYPDIHQGYRPTVSSVRDLLERRDLRGHARLLEADNFPQSDEHWDYVFEQRNMEPDEEE